MTGQELYGEFKAALDYLNAGFRGMADVQAIRAIPISVSPNTFTPTNTEGEQANG